MEITRIGILVVHGIGEQKRFQTLEEVALNFYKALRKSPEKIASARVLHGDQCPRHAAEEAWREAPIRVRWLAPGKQWMEAVFRETYWADLDLDLGVRAWLRLVNWALSMAGVRTFGHGHGIAGSPEDDPRVHGLRAPRRLTPLEGAVVRLKLFLMSWVLAPVFVLASGLQRIVLNRIGIRFPSLDRILHDYVGDVMLYQDWRPIHDRMEGFGERARVAIRRRMVRALLQEASDVERKELDGYFVFAHSLGTVVGFNGLMEPPHLLANYLTQEEWETLPPALKLKSRESLPLVQIPARPPWLDEHDMIDRKRVLSGLRGFVTVGSPLDKFAALWPAVVPVCEEGQEREIPWINVHELQDVVAGRIDLFTDQHPAKPPAGPLRVGCLRLSNHAWSGSRIFATAHTGYWKVNTRTPRLLDRLVTWVENPHGRFQVPQNVLPLSLARTWKVVSVFGCGAFILTALAPPLVAAVEWTLSAGGEFAGSWVSPLLELKGQWLEKALVLGSACLLLVLVLSASRSLRERSLSADRPRRARGR